MGRWEDVVRLERFQRRDDSDDRSPARRCSCRVGAAGGINHRQRR